MSPTNPGTQGNRSREPRPNFVLAPPPRNRDGDCTCAKPVPSGRKYGDTEVCATCGKLPGRAPSSPM